MAPKAARTTAAKAAAAPTAPQLVAVKEEAKEEAEVVEAEEASVKSEAEASDACEACGERAGFGFGPCDACGMVKYDDDAHTPTLEPEAPKLAPTPKALPGSARLRMPQQPQQEQPPASLHPTLKEPAEQALAEQAQPAKPRDHPDVVWQNILLKLMNTNKYMYKHMDNKDIKPKDYSRYSASNCFKWYITNCIMNSIIIQ